MRLSRRETLFGLAGLAIPAQLRPAGAAETSLAASAKAAGLVFGTSIAADTISGPRQAALYHREAGIFTADYAMKFGELRPEADVFAPEAANAILAFAAETQAPVRGHTLAWNESRPKWLMALSTAEKRVALDRHIDETAGYFAGKLQSWDVVNEPFWPGHGMPGTFRDGPWLEAFGPDYVTRAFRRAQAADPGTKLVLNEAMTEVWNDTGAAIRQGLLDLVDRLQQDGVRLDAVGLQGHLQPAKPYDDAAFGDFLGQLGERKIDIYITELDVDDTPFPDDVPTRDEAVAARYRDFLTTVLKVPAVKMVITWQLADSASWYYHAAQEADPSARRLPRPLPFDAHFAPKPAHRSIQQAFATRLG